MNRIIIVGNGFDLAYGLPTRYQDFLSWYLNEKVISVLENDNKYSDGLWSIFNYKLQSFNSYQFDDVKETYNYIKECARWSMDGTIDSLLLTDIFNGEDENWADIESSYFRLLIKYSGSSPNNLFQVRRLNKELSTLQDLLIEYLRIIDKSSPEDSVVSYASLTKKVDSNLIHEPAIAVSRTESYDLEDFMIINFNYTRTAEGIKASIESEGFNCKLIPIHGKLSGGTDKIIFGYGDETDPNFQLLKDTNVDLYLEHFKSYKYSKDNNLRKVFEFIDREPYDVQVIGHSCGISDRVLLSSIFDNDFCVSIAPYIRKDVNNYFSLQTAISRHIKDMGDYRRKIMIESACPRFNS